MLGFAPISGQAISGSPFKLTAIAAALTASISFTFAGTANTGLFSPVAATARVTFAGSGFLASEFAASATAGITFAGSPHLAFAGQPIVFTAMADSYTFRADLANYEFTAPAESYTFRGGKGR